MNWIKKINGDILFIVVVVLYFISRTPREDSIQPTIDILIGIALVLMVIKYVMVRFK